MDGSMQDFDILVNSRKALFNDHSNNMVLVNSNSTLKTCVCLTGVKFTPIYKKHMMSNELCNALSNFTLSLWMIIKILYQWSVDVFIKEFNRNGDDNLKALLILDSHCIRFNTDFMC